MRRILAGFVAMALMSAVPAFANSDGAKNTDASAKSGNTSSVAATVRSTKKGKESASNESSSSAAKTSTADPAVAVPPSAAATVSPFATVASPMKAQAGEPNPSPLSFKIGGADFTPLGFLDFTAVYRSTNVGSGIGTSFGSIPFNGASPAGRLSETRFSAQNSRVGLKVDANPGDFKVTG
ncbi:MAG: hypothetical protein ACRD4A_11160, partial [Candidatus Acidiferrales bacterium]